MTYADKYPDDLWERHMITEGQRLRQDDFASDKDLLAYLQGWGTEVLERWLAEGWEVPEPDDGAWPHITNFRSEPRKSDRSLSVWLLAYVIRRRVP